MEKLAGKDAQEALLADDEVDLLFSSEEHLRSPSHANKASDEDFCLMPRFNSNRGQFAQRHLFKSGFKTDISSMLK